MGVIASVGTTPKMFGGVGSFLSNAFKPPADRRAAGDDFKSAGVLKGELKAIGTKIDAANSKGELSKLVDQQSMMQDELKGMLSGSKQQTFFATAITLPITDILGSISKGIDKLVSFSPLLSAEVKKFSVGMRFLLMPIGNVLSNFLRPWILRFNRIAFKFFDD